jgi:hypothetical protein
MLRDLALPKASGAANETCTLPVARLQFAELLLQLPGAAAAVSAMKATSPTTIDVLVEDQTVRLPPQSLAIIRAGGTNTLCQRFYGIRKLKQQLVCRPRKVHEPAATVVMEFACLAL